MEEERMTTEFLQNMDWRAFDMAKQTQEQQSQIEEPIARFFTNHTKAELYEGAFKRGIMLAPISSPKDILENTQLKARDFWVEVEHPELGSNIRYPGAFVKASETPCVMKRRAPLIGEHNLEIYEGELGLSRDEICLLKQDGVI
jgi:crotonobetainyl-CoA:carnitine CoA-transferase CaiB-like acyl-CoA transferase